MTKEMQSLAALLVLPLLLVLLFLSFASDASDMIKCQSRWCGRHNISHPFRLQDSPSNCGEHNYTLSCEEDDQLILYWKSGKFKVQSINYNNFTIRLVDANIDLQSHHSYFSLPPYSFASFNFSRDAPYQYWFRTPNNDGVIVVMLMLYLRCPYQQMMESSSDLYVYNDTAATCINGSLVPGSSFNVIYYVDESLWDLGMGDSCRIEWMYLTSWDTSGNNNNLTNYNISSCRDIHNMLLYGFELSWAISPCKLDDWYSIMLDDHDNNNFTCYSSKHSIMGFLLDLWYQMAVYVIMILFYIGAKFVLGAPLAIIFFVYKWKRRHLSMYENIEDFLRSDNSIMPIRYSYKDIKSITEGFKTKLGSGGYGSVFRGKLRSSHLVAVKVLNNAKSNGQDFINEVTTIGRIHHVNVVQLIGFCIEGSKRALIYELMQNGSLEKYIFSNEENSSLSCEKLYNISLGVARGIEYLHNGCDMKILHFDIKPHNILLDKNFNPKVSDFGLARLYPTDNSIVSLTAARGTIGYMAPELFYRNVGSISYVYSFGMLLMEIASRRKNLNALNEHSSQIYYPFWVYDQLHDGKEIAIENDTDEEMKLAKKMMIVALWCIQAKPSGRPSMAKVVEMLEKDDEVLSLEMPPKPYFYDPNDVLAAEDHISDQSGSRPSSSDDISENDSNDSY